jgi:wobble nucleotide-excising tRNase
VRIDKVVEITNLGRFSSCRPKGDAAFKPLTVVYAENGRGKTTLSAILRSLGLGDCLALAERTAVAGTGAPKVILLVDGKPVTGDATAWSSTCRDIDVFDATFVENNVFSGAAVGPDHRHNLHSLAIGSRGVDLAKRVEDLAAKITEANGPLKIAENAVKVLAGGGLSVPGFCALPQVEDVDERLQACARDLRVAENKSLVEKTGCFAAVTAPDVPTEAVTAHLGSTLEGVSADAVEKTRRHITDHLGDAGEAWLGQGLDYLGDGDGCPFCGRSVADVALVTAYRQYFDDAYSEHIRKTTRLTSEVNARTSSAASAEVQRVIDENANVASFWRGLGVEWTTSLDTAQLQDRLHRLGEALRGALEAKARNPLDVVSVSPELEESIRQWGQQQGLIEEYNATVAAANAAVIRLKASAGTADASSLRDEVASLTKVKLRYEASSVEECDRYVDLLKEKTELEEEKRQSWTALEAESNRMIDAYAADINAYLTKFGAQFGICDATEDRHGGKPRFDYCLDIDGCRIPLGARTAGEPCFGNTLSAGDKNALAFAFYLAKLRRDPDLAKKVVVLDDPICSLDIGRKASTRQEIAALSNETSQVILMSHDALFLRDVWTDAEPSGRAALKVASAGRDSTIVALDIERETQAQHYADYVRLTEYVTGESTAAPGDVARAIRPLLEGNLRLRFPGKVGSRKLGEFLKEVADADPADPLAILVPLHAEISLINDYAKKYHHSENPAASSEPVNEGELTAYSKRALKVVSQILVVGLTN